MKRHRQPLDRKKMALNIPRLVNSGTQPSLLLDCLMETQVTSPALLSPSPPSPPPSPLSLSPFPSLPSPSHILIPISRITLKTNAQE